MTAHRLVAKTMLAALIGVTTAIVGSSSASAQEAIVDVQIDGQELVISLVDPDVPIGAIAIEVSPVPEFDDEDCVLHEGFGGCSHGDGVLRLSAFDPSGWQHDLTLATVSLPNPVDRDDLSVVVPLIADVLAQEVTAGVQQSSGIDRGLSRVVLGGIAVIAVLIVGIAIAQRATKRHPDE